MASSTVPTSAESVRSVDREAYRQRFDELQRRSTQTDQNIAFTISEIKSDLARLSAPWYKRVGRTFADKVGL